MNQQSFLSQSRAIERAGILADENGAPVAVVFDPLGRWYRLCENADEYEELLDVDGFEPVAVIDPTEAN